MVTEEEFLKEHPSLKGKRIEGWNGKVLDLDGKAIPSDNQFYSEEDIHETQLDKKKAEEVIDNPVVIPIVMKRTTESWEEFRTRCYEAERERIKEELGIE